MVVAVAAERYHAICYPLKHKPSSAFYNGLAVIVSFLVNIPKFFEFRRKQPSPELIVSSNESSDTFNLDYWTTELNENPRYVVFSSYHEVAVIGFVPLIALCYLNYKIYVKIKKSMDLTNRLVFSTFLPSHYRSF